MRLTSYFPFDGGLNLIDPPLSIKPGELLGSSNYELFNGGYRRIDGYERLDGRASPSEQSYWILNYDAGTTATPPVGSIVQGGTSGSRGKVWLDVLSTGTWSGGNAAGYLVIFGATGSFINNESLSFTGVDDGFDTGFSNGFG